MKTMRLKGSRRSGLTLLEVIIASCVLAVVMFMSYSILYSTTSTATQGEMTSQLEKRGKELMANFRKQFYDAEFTTLHNYAFPSETFTGQVGIHDNGTQIHFQVACNMDGNGSLQYGFFGDKVDMKEVVDAGTNLKSYVATNSAQWAGRSCVIRFEPEVVLFEGTAASQVVVQQGTADISAPPTFKPIQDIDPVTKAFKTRKSFAKGATLPYRCLNRDLNGDGLKTKVYVKGQIWKYVMNPYPLGGYNGDANIITTEQLSDDVLLAVTAAGTYDGDVDVVTPVAGTEGKDWLFRFVTSAASLYPYGVTDMNIPAAQSFPSANSVALAWTVWHCVENERGKGFYMRKSWEKMPFRLTTGK